MTETIPKHLGLARSTGKATHWGIRVHADHFAEAFATMHPGKPIPAVVVTHYLAKISPVPTGATSDNVRKWLATQNINGKPVRLLNPSTWMISTVARQERAFYTWGQNSILLVPIQSWLDRSRPTVVAGQQKQPRGGTNSDLFDEDILQVDDPWAKWLPSSNASTASSSSADKSGYTAPSHGSFASSKQQAEIVSIRDKLKSLEDRFAQKDENDTKWKASITKDVKAFKEEVRNDLQGMETKYQTTLESTLAKTETKISESMNASILKLQGFVLSQAKGSSTRPMLESPAKSEPDEPM